MKKDKEAYKKTGWEILNNKNSISMSCLSAKISITVERNEYLGQDRLRVSRKTLHEAFKLINDRTQRIRSKKRKQFALQKDNEVNHG